MNVLSVDFDYFQDVTEEHLRLYPDGIDYNTVLSEFIWASHYATDGEELSKIGLLEKEYDTLKRILLNQNYYTPVMIANSHVHIYDFIHGHLSEEDSLGICNVDMHHDMFNDNDKLDCGNWLGYISNERKEQEIAFKWVHNPISLSVYGIEEEMKQFEGRFLSSLASLEDKKFDAVFLCRSDIWTPPHLDGYFRKLCELINSHYCNVEIIEDVNKPRTMYLQYKRMWTKMIQKG